MTSRLGFDVLAAFILAITAATGAYLPMYLVQREKSSTNPSGRSRALIIGNMFSAGVMVSAGFCHLLGEAVKTMPAMQFSLATFLCGLGYLITLCADKAATILTGLHSSPSSSGNLDQGVEVIVGVDLAERAVSTPDSRLNRPINSTPGPIGAVAKERLSFSSNEELALLRTEQGSSSSPTMTGNMNFAAARQRRDSAIQDGTVVLNRTGSDVTGMLSSSRLELRGTAGIAGTDIESAAGGIGGASSSLGGGTNGMVPSSAFELEDGPGLETHGGGGNGGGSGIGGANGGGRYQPVGCHNLHYGHNHSHHNHHASAGGATVSFITAVLMAVALCFHSLLEGAAMGAQPTIANSLHIFIAIVSHKGLAAYALGSSIAESNVGVKRFWSVALPFTFASPVGIFIGYIISDIAQGVGAAAISALASGTFLYVAFMEVIPRELHNPGRILEKLGALLLGFGLMSLLAIWA